MTRGYFRIMFFTPAEILTPNSSSCIEIENRRQSEKKSNIFAKIAMLSNSERKKNLLKNDGFSLASSTSTTPDSIMSVFFCDREPSQVTNQSQLEQQATSQWFCFFYFQYFLSLRSPTAWRSDVYLFSEIFASSFCCLLKRALFSFSSKSILFMKRGN